MGLWGWFCLTKRNAAEKKDRNGEPKAMGSIFVQYSPHLFRS
jgi:hypothetical protein